MVEQAEVAAQDQQSATELFNEEHRELLRILKDDIVPRIERMHQLF